MAAGQTLAASKLAVNAGSPPRGGTYDSGNLIKARHKPYHSLRGGQNNDFLLANGGLMIASSISKRTFTDRVRR